MLLLFMANFFPLYAQCPLKKKVPQQIKTIKTTDISALIEKGSGCITLVELWASWCGTCKKTKPKIKSILKKNPSIAHLSISADHHKSILKKYLLQKKSSLAGQYFLRTWTLASLKDAFIEKEAHFENAIPLILLYDPQGKLQYQATEPTDLHAIEERIEQIQKP